MYTLTINTSLYCFSANKLFVGNSRTTTALLRPHLQSCRTPSPPQNITTLLHQQTQRLKYALGEGNCFFCAQPPASTKQHYNTHSWSPFFICPLDHWPQRNQAMYEHLQDMKIVWWAWLSYCWRESGNIPTLELCRSLRGRLTWQVDANIN